jgi:hypothetical protein
VVVLQDAARDVVSTSTRIAGSLTLHARLDRRSVLARSPHSSDAGQQHAVDDRHDRDALHAILAQATPRSSSPFKATRSTTSSARRCATAKPVVRWFAVRDEDRRPEVTVAESAARDHAAIRRCSFGITARGGRYDFSYAERADAGACWRATSTERSSARTWPADSSDRDSACTPYAAPPAPPN